MSSSTDIDVWNPRRPFSERSAKKLYMALKDEKTAMNDEELKMLRLFHQLLLKAVEVINGTHGVKDLMVQTEVELKMAKAWLFARNAMATSLDQERVDLTDPDVVTEMIVESTRVVDEVTALAERWQELALKPHKVDMKTIRWIIQATKVKTEVRMMLSMFMSAEAVRRWEKGQLQWIMEQG